MPQTYTFALLSSGYVRGTCAYVLVWYLHSLSDARRFCGSCGCGCCHCIVIEKRHRARFIAGINIEEMREGSFETSGNACTPCYCNEYLAGELEDSLGGPLVQARCGV